MRPVEKGPVPLEADGSNRIYSAYGQARRDLIDRMGQYCSYCNQKLPSSLAVEHVQPKSLNPALELEWSNFLLGCTNCNSTKGTKPVNLSDYFWPDIHNTHIPFTYTPDGKIDVNPLLPDPLKIKAQNMLELVGLQSYPDNPTASDRRWLNRKDAFVKANIALVLYQSAVTKGASAEFEEALGLWASDNGFFSIWMHVFNAYPKVKQQIILSFTGTSAICFDANINAINRTPEL